MRWLLLVLVLLVGCPELNRTPTTVTGVLLEGRWLGQLEKTSGLLPIVLVVEAETLTDTKTIYWEGSAKLGQVEYTLRAIETLPVSATCLTATPKGSCEVPFYLARSSLQFLLYHPTLPTLEVVAERRLDGQNNVGRLNGTLGELGVTTLPKDLVRLERQ